MSSKSKKSSANGGDENDTKFRVAKIGDVEIKYQTKVGGRDWTYVDPDDPEVLAATINGTQGKRKPSAAESGKWHDRLTQRLRELDYPAIPEVEPELSTFRAKHVLQCFQVRLADVWKKLKAIDDGPIDKTALNSAKTRGSLFANDYATAIRREKSTFKRIHDDIKSLDTGEYTEELEKLSNIIGQLTQLEEDYKEPSKYVADHVSQKLPRKKGEKQNGGKF